MQIWHAQSPMQFPGAARGLRARARPGDEPSPAGIDSDYSPPSTSRSTPKRSSELRADFLLGLSIRQHLTAYALLRFTDLQPLQFGLIDVRKTIEVQQKGLEIAAVLRDLRKNAPQKLQRVASEIEDVEIDANKKWRWVVSIDESAADLSLKTKVKQQHAQRAAAVLQGLVIGDCKRLFRVAPTVVHPRQSRQLLGVRGNGPAARKEVFEIATERIPDFPAIRGANGVLNEDSFFMSDAWAAARYTQRYSLLAEKLNDRELVEKLREQAMESKKIIRMQEAVEELSPRKAGKELAAVLETQIEQYIKYHMHRMLDLRELRHAEQSEEAEEADNSGYAAVVP